MVLAMLCALLVADHATLPCGQIKEYVAALGKQNVINGAKKHGYTDAQIAELMRRCQIV